MMVHTPASRTMWWKLLCLVSVFWHFGHVHLTSAQQQLGGRLFISLDCGGLAPDFSDQSVPNITWQSDQAFIPTGLSGQIQQPAGSTATQFQNLRYFPPGASPAKNCYSFPVELTKAYLIRAGFLYGNYDGLLSSSIKFQIALDSTPWEDVTIFGSSSSVAYFEIITAPSAEKQLSVCLIRTGSSSAFINTLELREVGSRGYTHLLKSPVHLRLGSRVNFGERTVKSPMRFPHDPCDRFWPTDADLFPDLGGTPFEAPAGQLLSVEQASNNTDVTPNAVVRTGITGPNLTYTRQVLPNSRMYTWTYWVDLNGSVGPNDSRVMDWSDSTSLSVGTFTLNQDFAPFMLAWRGYYQQSTGSSTTFTVFGTRGAASTMDVIVNADELYYVQDLVVGTQPQDVAALDELKTRFNIAHWLGDPCLPVPWDELSCSITGSVRVTSLNLSGRKLRGLIPATIINQLSRLTSLNLSNNSFEWEIPNSLQNLTSLSVLDLSKNKLAGSLSSWMESLEKLDVSDNQLDGTFPSSLLSSPAFRYSGNPLLQCLQVGRISCNDSLPAPPKALPPSIPNASSNSTSSPVVAIVGGTAAALILTAVIGIAIWCCKFRKASTHMSEDEGGAPQDVPRIPGAQVAAFSREDVRRATDNYAHKLGGGGFGPVYYGLLNTRKEEVAVKIMSGKSSQGSDEFFNEIALLSTIHHKNLVSLVGYCHQPPDLVLLYEYMPGGDLRERLYGRNAAPPLTWLQRLNIARDAATGLHYLHNGCKRGIIHRDIKSSNILLSQKMEARLADFGLSKLKHEDDTGVDQLMTRVQGTPGYLDPDYRTTGILTVKSDIYSFGVVLMEILSGQPVFAAQATNLPPEDRYIVHRVQNAVNTGTVEKVVDPALGSNYTRETAWSLAEIALKCAELKSAARPKIDWILNELTKTVEKEGLHTLSHFTSFSTDMHTPSSQVRPR